MLMVGMRREEKYWRWVEEMSEIDFWLMLMVVVEEMCEMEKEYECGEVRIESSDSFVHEGTTHQDVMMM